ncbi:MAG: MMPL family transporter, partial [Candidatus Nanopelagicales bacterium]|nr:MMPL family transporter [Candidatus Nanopelagicales bacterium]
MTAALYRLARASAKHRWLVLAGWVLMGLFIVGLNNAIPGAPKSTFSLSGTDSATAINLVGAAFSESSSGLAPIVLHDPNADLTTGSGAQIVSRTVAALEARKDVVGLIDPTEQPSLMSADHHTAILQLTPTSDALRTTAQAADLLQAAQDAAGPGVEVAASGILGTELSSPATHTSELLGLGAAVIVLFLTLRRWSAVFIPLINAIVAVGLGLAVIKALGKLVFIPDVAPTLGTMLGLGVGIDYALFLITRHRKMLSQGFSVPDSLGRTAGTAGAGLVFAGGTLIAAVCGLALTGLSFLTWLGISAAIVVALAVLSSLTLVPALLSIVGRRILPKKIHALDHGQHDALDRSGWARIADAVTGRPWTAAIVSIVLLLILALPVTTMSLGMSDAGDMPKNTTARQSYDMINEGFGPGANGPLLVVAQLFAPAQAPAKIPPGTKDPRTADPRLVSLRQDLGQTQGVISTNPPVVSPDGGVAFIQVTPAWAPSDPRTSDLVSYLRTTTLPRATFDEGMAAHVGGITAATSDLFDLIAERTPWFIVGVILLAFTLLMLAYRSLLIPFKAALMNLVSITAAYGVVTAIFEKGWGAHLIGLEGPIPIDSYVPMMMFAVLFGLSMDYEVFLLTSFREHWAQSGDMVVSVRRGLADTGRLVTSAAFIMVVVFASFILSDTPLVKLFGVGLATAVIVDATIVRCVLVPAIMVLAAKGTWWLPGWLDRLLPHLHVEGDPTALDELASKPKRSGVGHRTLIAARPTEVIGAVVGAGASWFLMSHLPGVPTSLAAPIAAAAVVGA